LVIGIAHIGASLAPRVIHFVYSAWFGLVLFCLPFVTLTIGRAQKSATAQYANVKASHKKRDKH